MRLRQSEIKAIVLEIQSIQADERDKQIIAFKEKQANDGRFEELAHIIKTKFGVEFKMFLNVKDRDLSESVQHIADVLRRDYADSEFEPVGLKGYRELEKEVILKANAARNGTPFQDIIKCINPFKNA